MLATILTLIRKSWWLLVLNGVAAALFGLLALAWPDRTLGGLITLFGAYVLVDGVLSLVGIPATAALGVAWWPLLLRGLSGIGIGLVTFNWPGLTAQLLLYIIAIWAIAIGLCQVLVGVILRKQIEREWLLILSGIGSVLFGGWLIASPGEGALALVWLIGIFALAFGALSIAAGLRLRGAMQHLDQRLHLDR